MCVGVWSIDDGKLLARLTDTEPTSVVVSHVAVTRDARYVIAVESRHSHRLVNSSEHVVIYDVSCRRRLFDDTSQVNVVQLTATTDCDKVGLTAAETAVYLTDIVVATIGLFPFGCPIGNLIADLG